MEEATSGRFGGRLSAVLFLLCGSLVAVAVPLVPSAPSANRGALLAIAGVTLAPAGSSGCCRGTGGRGRRRWRCSRPRSR